MQLASKSLMVLYKAHAVLGEARACCTDQGQLLLVFVDEIRAALQHPIVTDLINAKDSKFSG